MKKHCKSIEQAATFWSRPRARHEPNDHKLVKKFALWRLDVPCPPCLWRAVTDDLVKSRSKHAAVRLTTQCVHSVAQMLQNQGSRRVRARFGDRAHGCASRCAPGVQRVPKRAHGTPFQGWNAPENCPGAMCTPSVPTGGGCHAHGHAPWIAPENRHAHRGHAHEKH